MNEEVIDALARIIETMIGKEKAKETDFSREEKHEKSA